MCEKVRQLCRCIVVIPALDPDETLPGYVSALLERGAEQVMVVDDGSKPSCQPVSFDRSVPWKTEMVRVREALRQEINAE